MCKIIRELLASNHYSDLDIVNCHLALTLAVVDIVDRDASVDTLRETVIHREGYYKIIMDHYHCSRADAKVLVLAQLNLGTAYGWQREMWEDANQDAAHTLPFKAIADHPKVVQFECEMVLCQHLVLQQYPGALEKAKCRPETDKMRAAIAKGHQKKQLKKLAFSIAIMTLENKAISAVEEYLRSQDFNVDALIFDGLMPRCKEDAISQDVIHGCNKAMHTALGSGFESIRLEVKEFKIGSLAQAWLEEAKSAQEEVGFRADEL